MAQSDISKKSARYHQCADNIHECCLNWYHVKSGDISDDEYQKISETVWYCRKCFAIREKNKSGQQSKLFLRYVDDIVRTVKGDPENVLRAANLLHPNLQFTTETPNTNGTLAFLDLQISIDKSRKISCGWYQKPTDTGTILNFRSCTPFSTREVWLKELFTGFSAVRQHGKNMIKPWKSTVSSGWITDIRKVGRRELHPMLLKIPSARAKTKRTWLRKRSPVIIATTTGFERAFRNIYRAATKPPNDWYTPAELETNSLSLLVF